MKPSMDPDEPAGMRDRNEAPGERLDRQWNELLQELRVTQTGIQLLGGFLLILPFQVRFTALTSGLRTVYLVAVVCATLSLFLVLTPIVTHRALFRTHRKDLIVATAHRTASLGLGFLAVTEICVVGLVFGVVLGHAAALYAGLGTGLVGVGLWWLLPSRVARMRPAASSTDGIERYS
ncbi:DUF6328 family protein [Raineyella fluvialis]|uniref:DUF6328 family protein n=1 Tax=Raineyella fluvialis TaxID=2662261 RepID=UPI00188F608F|nr:DUF6328 family protein [Raineyella fluvialis]